MPIDESRLGDGLRFSFCAQSPRRRATSCKGTCKLSSPTKLAAPAMGRLFAAALPRMPSLAFYKRLGCTWGVAPPGAIPISAPGVWAPRTHVKLSISAASASIMGEGG